VIQAEIAFYGWRDFHSLAILRLAVSDRRNKELHSIVDDFPGNDHDYRAIFKTLFLAALCLVGPQIGVTENVSRFGRLP